MDVDTLCADAFDLAAGAGWHARPTGEVDRVLGNLALCHSELSEALETYRVSMTRTWVEVDGKPEGWGAELADVIIRVCELFKITMPGESLAAIIEAKMAYNHRRADVPARGGRKVV